MVIPKSPFVPVSLSQFTHLLIKRPLSYKDGKILFFLHELRNFSRATAARIMEHHKGVLYEHKSIAQTGASPLSAVYFAQHFHNNF